MVYVYFMMFASTIIAVMAIVARVHIKAENDHIERMALVASANAEQSLLRGKGLCN